MLKLKGYGVKNATFYVLDLGFLNLTITACETEISCLKLREMYFLVNGFKLSSL